MAPFPTFLGGVVDPAGGGNLLVLYTAKRHRFLCQAFTTLLCYRYYPCSADNTAISTMFTQHEASTWRMVSTWNFSRCIQASARLHHRVLPPGVQQQHIQVFHDAEHQEVPLLHEFQAEEDAEFL